MTSWPWIAPACCSASRIAIRSPGRPHLVHRPHQIVQGRAGIELEHPTGILLHVDGGLLVTAVCPPASGLGWETCWFSAMVTVSPPWLMAAGRSLTSLPMTMVPVREFTMILADLLAGSTSRFSMVER